MSWQGQRSGSFLEAPGSPAPPLGGDRFDRLPDALLVGRTVAAGVVDAVTDLGLGHILAPNMTGNAEFLARAVRQASLLTARYSAGAFLGFSVGAMVAVDGPTR
ncbi:MAG: DUF1275 domain-containing protein [Thermoplasmata archaeon]|nr:DUF1275 domain-containing protein [Thermoplasmata archaeon]